MKLPEDEHCMTVLGTLRSNSAVITAERTLKNIIEENDRPHTSAYELDEAGNGTEPCYI